jgi:hypothetical protein
LVLVVLLSVLGVLSAALVIGPLVVGRVPRGHGGPIPHVRLRAYLYFASLGFGYLFVMLPLAQRLIVFVGDTVTALAVVFFSVLLWSGIGSLNSPRCNLRLALLGLVLAILILPAALQILLPWALALQRPLRLIFVAVLLAPTGLLMGVPFALGLSTYELRAPGITPWAWAVNGTASVLSGVLATMLAVACGFSVVIWSGAVVYALALCSVWPFATPSTRVSAERRPLRLGSRS